MPAPLLIAGASFLFAVMGLCVKLASAQYTAGEIVFYRSLVGLVLLGALLRVRGVGLRTPVPAMHFWRGLCGVGALCLWFFALGGLPLATAMTMNYMSSVWMALFLLGGAVLLGSARVDGRLVAAVLAGFGGVALILRPTVDQQQVWHGLAGLASGMLSAMAYLQVTALGRAGEPETRVVFYFSLGGVLAGAAIAAASGGFGTHSAKGLALLLAIGLCAAAAQLMMTRAYTIGSALTNATLQYLGIVFAVMFGIWIFDDPLSLPTLAGIALIVGAGITATLIGARTRSDRALPPSEA